MMSLIVSCLPLVDAKKQIEKFNFQTIFPRTLLPFCEFAFHFSPFLEKGARKCTRQTNRICESAIYPIMLYLYLHFVFALLFLTDVKKKNLFHFQCSCRILEIFRAPRWQHCARATSRRLAFQSVSYRRVERIEEVKAHCSRHSRGQSRGCVCAGAYLDGKRKGSRTDVR